MDSHPTPVRRAQLHADVAAEVRRRFGTPCYGYDRAALESAARAALAFPAPFGLTLRYAMKANPSRGILTLFRDLGLHVDASSDHEVERALRAGANGYIMKQEATGKVLVAVRRILNGEIYVSDRVASRMLKHYITGSGTLRNSSIADLSDRELEVFRLIGEGHGTRQIAEELHISVKTVESYQAHIKEKLSLRSARELMQHAIQWNLNEKAG